MPEQPDRQRLDLTLAVGESDAIAPALAELASMSERARRAVLRPHWEDPQGVRDERQVALRRGLDAAFYQLAALELAVSTGYLPEEQARQAVPPVLPQLLKSRAVARFVDDYSYFQVRLLGARLGYDGIKLPRVPVLPALDPSPDVDNHVESFFRRTIRLQQRPDIDLLYAFLDGFPSETERQLDNHTPALDGAMTGDRFRLWLADRDTEQDPGLQRYFEQLRSGLASWVSDRSDAYLNQPEPVQARLAIFDIYWLLKLFNAQISTCGDVKYSGSSWLTFAAESPHVLGDDAERGYEPPPADRVAEERHRWYAAKRVLRRALGLACDWIRGEAIEPLPKRAPQPARSADAPVAWLDVFRDELKEIQAHRRERHLAPFPDEPGEPDSGASDSYSARHGLIGLAFSGGGIRSATFNLGVLEALKENGLLRLVDYLSTVSGGGYIGGWLVANAKRRGYWVRREADWRESIKYLRDYSNYLSPHLGFLSADTWTMWTTFLRNTLLVQLQVLLALAAAMLVPYLLRAPFRSLLGGAGTFVVPYFEHPGLPCAVLLGLCTLLVGAGMSWKQPANGARVQRYWQRFAIASGVVLLIPAAIYVTAGMWRLAQEYLAAGADTYGGVLSRLVQGTEFLIVIGLIYAGKLLLSLMSVRRNATGIAAAILAPFGAIAALLLEAAALVLVLQHWLPYARMDHAGIEAAFVFGPVLVMTLVSVSIYILIGLLGRASDEQAREWWSRYGALLFMAGAGWLLITGPSVYGPLGVERLGTVKWIPVLGWVATTLGSVLAGKSGSTSGDAKPSRLAIDLLAVAGPFVAIAGIVVGVAAGIRSVLLALSPAPPASGPDSAYWLSLGAIDPKMAWLAFAVVLGLGALLTWRVDINIFALSEFYRNRLVRCYLGATRTRRSPHPFTGFDDHDDLALARLQARTPAVCRLARDEAARDDNEGRAPFSGPFPIVNCTLNLGGSSDLAVKTRQSDSFAMTPLYCGFNHKAAPGQRFTAAGGYRPTASFCGSKGGLTLGQAVAVSGAAANPNMGYHTAPLTSFLMTVFNARLGGWFANPSLNRPATSVSPTFAFGSLLDEMFGTADDTSRFVDVSDGGHFENLGIYELVRRRCRLIVSSDAECDPDLNFAGLGNVIRLCEVDFGAKIRIDVSSIRKDPATGRSKSHCAVGRIEYANGGIGDLIYIKSSLLESEDTAVLEYMSGHPTFPHETTADQFFTEDQFESYRKLGYDCGRRTFRDSVLRGVTDVDLEQFAREMTETWTPVRNSKLAFISSTRGLIQLWETLGKDAALRNLSNEIINHTPPPPGRPTVVTPREFYFCNEIIQLMENVHLDLDLDDTWDDPDNAGWKDLFLKCSRSATFRVVWEKSNGTYGKRFHNFCRRKLNLS